MLELTRLQAEHKEWQERNFPDQKDHQPLLGILEELGEICHAHLKAEQGIRGSESLHFEEKKDAIGDVMIYLANYCNRFGINLQTTVGLSLDAINWHRTEAYGDLLLAFKHAGVMADMHYTMELAATPSMHHYFREKLLDSIRNMVFYLAKYSKANGISIKQAIFDTWEEVKKRDWRKNPENGVAVG